MKEIILTRDMKTSLDDEAWSVLKDYNWIALECFTQKTDRKRFSARRDFHINGHRFFVYLHRQVMGVPKPFIVRHKNTEHLDNQHQNLQIEDEGGNIYHFRTFTTKSIYRGVVWDKFYGLWRAEFHGLTIGYYTVEIDAARAYNIKIKEIYGNAKRRLNTIRIMREYNRKNHRAL